MLIYSHSLTPRLQYTVDFLSQYYGIPIKLIYDEEKYLAAADAHRINYSYHRLSDEEVWIHSHVLLTESTVRPVKVECFDYHGHPAFFKAEGDTGFDLFAAIFFLLTRYEEYLPHSKDSYGRFAHTGSVAFKNGFLHLPLINIWLEDFRKLLQQKFPGIQLQSTSFRFQATYDIDMAWSFRHKGFKRNAGAIAKLFFTGKWRSMAHRIGVIRGKRQDPFDAYGWMNNLHQQHSLQPLYFFLVAERLGKYDKNIPVLKPALKQLIKEVAAANKVAPHPSWASGDQPALLKKEKAWLEKTAEQNITESRQHYIRFNLPNTYRQLLSAGITHDYSMGYGSINGFRASVATPFFWYDLKEEKQTALQLHPFCFMDANAYYEEGKTAAEALADMEAYASVVRSVGGTMITIWHNSFLGTDPSFDGWRDVYASFIESQVP